MKRNAGGQKRRERAGKGEGRVGQNEGRNEERGREGGKEDWRSWERRRKREGKQ